MVREKKMSLFKTTNTKIIFYVISFLASFFSACSDENPFDQVEDDISESRHEIELDLKKHTNSITTSESEKCLFGTSSHTDSWCCSNYGYRCNINYIISYTSSSRKQSSSSTAKSTYTNSRSNILTTSKTLHFTLTYYKQTACSIEGKSAKNCNYSDGDPIISFKIEFIKTDGNKTTFSTINELGKYWFYRENIGEWKGVQSFTANAPAMTDTIRVCPTVVDDDILFQDKMYSEYCYYIYNVGALDNREVVYQSDYKNNYCNLEWEWYLY